MVAGETVYAALFSRLQSKVTLCKTFSRKWLEGQQVGAEQQPALLCLEGDELVQEDASEPAVFMFEAAVVVYVRTNDVATPGTAISNILDQIKAAMLPQPEEGYAGYRAHTNLGLAGVDRAWIAGQIMKEDGTLSGGQGWISLTVHIVVNP